MLEFPDALIVLGEMMPVRDKMRLPFCHDIPPHGMLCTGGSMQLITVEVGANRVNIRTV